MSNIIDKIQVSGVTYDIGGGSITIDPTLDSGSTNPVANSAITTALDEKVNLADNIVSAATINYTYDKGDTDSKYPYNNGLIINEFYVKPVNQYAYTNTAAWNNVYISNGSSYTGIKVNVDCSNYQITAVTSTSGDNFTYAIEDGVLHITLSEGYTVQTFSQSPVFQISYKKYTIESGQTADVINEDLIDTIQDIYDQVPKAYLTAVTPSLVDSNRLVISNYKSDGTNVGKIVQFGTSIRGDNNKMDVYLPSRNTTSITLNTGTGSYSQIPSLTVNDYNTGFAYIQMIVNTGYTGSTTSFTFTVKTIYNNNGTVTDTFTYDTVHRVIGGSQTYIDVSFTSFSNLITIYPRYSNYRILSVTEPTYKIGGINSFFKEQYVITGVTAQSFLKQANTVISEIYSELSSKASTTYVDQSTSGKAETTAVTEAISEATSGKVDTSVYTAYTAATDTALAGKQTTLTAGTGIDITDNVISATGGGGKAIEAGRGITVTTGATADTVSFNLPISAGTGSYSIVEGQSTTANGSYSHTEGIYTTASGESSHAEGDGTVASGDSSHAEGSYTTAKGESSHAEGVMSSANGSTSHAEGVGTIASGNYSHAEGHVTIANNESEHASGQYNISNSASTTFGDSGNTLFSVGNGTSNNARHNAFEIRQNGDIYLSSGGTDIKLQDHLGGGGSSYTAGDGIDITNDVISVIGKADTSAVTEVSDALTAHTANTTVHTTAAEKTSWNGAVTDIATVSGQVSTNTTNIATVSAATTANTTALGGLSLIKLSQAQYDSLVTKDNSTLYVIVD